MLDKNKKEIIKKHLEKFVPTTVRTLRSSLDKDVYKKIELSIASFDTIEDLSSLNKGKACFQQVFQRAKSEQGCFFTFLPEEFIANMSDVIMGGEGNVEYKGSLSELEINASINLLEKLNKELLNLSSKINDSEIVSEEKPVFVDPATMNIVDLAKENNCDYLINAVLKINSEKDYAISVLTSSQGLNQNLTKLGLFKWEPQKKRKEIDEVNINIISDLEINLNAVLGRAEIPIKKALELSTGSLIELDATQDSDVKVLVRGVEVAQAQIVVVGDNFGLRITKIISPEERLRYTK